MSVYVHDYVHVHLYVYDKRSHKNGNDLIQFLKR